VVAAEGSFLPQNPLATPSPPSAPTAISGARPLARPTEGMTSGHAELKDAFKPAMTEEHSHHTHPSRCCAAEDARDVLARLRANPPRRLGYQNPSNKQWSGESVERFAARVGAWEAAVAREEALLKTQEG
jgi:hypothetical protein